MFKINPKYGFQSLQSFRLYKQTIDYKKRKEGIIFEMNPNLPHYICIE